jgi:hypothetical protein
MQDVSSHGATRSLRVLVLTNMYPSPTRPIHGTFVAEQVDSLRQRGLHIDVLFVDGPELPARREAITPHPARAV